MTCKNAPKAFAEVSHNVMSMHVVLDAVHEHWDRNDLSQIHRQDLYYLADASEQPLRKLEELLHAHGGLGGGRNSRWDRIRWTTKSLIDKIRPIQAELASKSEPLFKFHAVISQ